MRYLSTNQKAPPVSLRDAVLAGLAPDGGLYVPERIPVLDQEFFARLPSLTFPEIAAAVLTPFLDLPAEKVLSLAEDAFDFPGPLVSLSDRINALELYHGPTLAFKDFGARFMARLFSELRDPEGPAYTVLAATSGDTGTAVAHGFYGMPGFRVVILYPSGQVSEVQEKQLTTLGGNVTALEVSGTFDDCQKLVKTAFLDKSLAGHRINLTSANSINIARLLPQTLYFFSAVSELLRHERPIIISVPSGNFGNLTAGLFARAMGLPVAKFVAATNRNDVVPQYLHSGVYSPRASIQTLSNAMDVGNPSNFARIQWLYKNSLDQIRLDVSGRTYSDEKTLHVIKTVWETNHYLLDPHGAVGYLALEAELATNPDAIGIFLETAHPAKFIDTVEEALGGSITMPERLEQTMKKTKHAVPLAGTYEALREYLIGPLEFS